MQNIISSLDRDVMFIIIAAIITLGVIAFLALTPVPRNGDCISITIGGGAYIINPIPSYTEPIQLNPDLVNATIDVTVKVEANITIAVEVWDDNGLIYQGTGKNVNMKKTINGTSMLIIVVEPVDEGKNLSDAKIEYSIESRC